MKLQKLKEKLESLIAGVNEEIEKSSRNPDTDNSWFVVRSDVTFEMIKKRKILENILRDVNELILEETGVRI